MSFLKPILAGCLIAAQSNLVRAQKRHNNMFDASDNPQKLVVQPDNSFRIMQITDLHLGEDPEKDKKTINMIWQMYMKEEPDFIAITGDLVSG